MFRCHDLRLAIIEIITAAVLLIEANVARRFFQRRDADSGVFQEIGSNVGNILAGDMRSTQLRYGIVAIADQHAVIERSRFF